MTSPFLSNPVTSQRKLFDEHFVEKEFLARQNPLAFPDSYLYERYRFSAEGMSYLCELLEPHIKNLTRRIHVLTVPQILRCVFFCCKWYILVRWVTHRSSGKTQFVEPFVRWSSLCRST
ncbi:hypothetical protein PO909_002860 [Leuciscus waleckii]